ncbi:hypothetical protein OROGR_001031 [Orobanche gracilis]
MTRNYGFETGQPSNQSLDGYKHVVNIKYCPPVFSESPNFSTEAAKAKEAAQNETSTRNTTEYHEIVEVDVKNEWFHNSGAGVVAHVADSIKQQAGAAQHSGILGR